MAPEHQRFWINESNPLVRRHAGNALAWIYHVLRSDIYLSSPQSLEFVTRLDNTALISADKSSQTEWSTWLLSVDPLSATLSHPGLAWPFFFSAHRTRNPSPPYVQTRGV